MRRWNFGALALLMTIAGCAQIIDLEERKYDSTATPGEELPKLALDCPTYCSEVKELCPADRNVQQFNGDDPCLGVCDKYVKDPAVTGNTLACRMDKLAKLRSVRFEVESYCPGAGPLGGAPPNEDMSLGCGTNCQSFCALRAATCAPENVEPDCERRCQALVDIGTFNAAIDFSSNADTLQCRVAHLSAAASFALKGDTMSRDAHCRHSGLRSEQQCDFKTDKPPDCVGYCKIVSTICTGDAQIYESQDQCLKVCEKIPPGLSADKATAATRRCIREGPYDALTINKNLCVTATPAPDRCGRGKCHSYCQLAKANCEASFNAAYPQGLEQCEGSCRVLPGAEQNAPYSVNLDQAQGGLNFQCRLLQLTRAMEGRVPDVKNACDQALGLAGCK